MDRVEAVEAKQWRRGGLFPCKPQNHDTIRAVSGVFGLFSL